MGVVLVDIRSLEQRFESRAAVEEADEGQPNLLPTNRDAWSPQWGSLTWAKERYGQDFLRSYRWITGPQLIAEVLAI